MKYGAIKRYDVADGPGCRISLFVSGCRNHCKGCFQPETWDFNYGEEYTDAVQFDILKTLADDNIQGLTILGGDPFEEENQPFVEDLVLAVRGMFEDRKDIWVYTGYVLENDLLKGGRKYVEGITDEILNYIDILVDGPFIEEKKNLALEFRGSENQRIINMKEFFRNRRKQNEHDTN